MCLSGNSEPRKRPDRNRNARARLEDACVLSTTKCQQRLWTLIGARL